MMYDPKYHFELNYIEHFWCNVKKWTRKNCQYTFEDLPYYVSPALTGMPNKIFLVYYYRCQCKIDYYNESLFYGSVIWKRHTAHQKPTNKDENRYMCWWGITG